MFKKVVVSIVLFLCAIGTIAYAEQSIEGTESAAIQEERAQRVKRFSGTAKEVSPGKYPWIVRLENDNGWATGFLIDRKYVLTAAHNLEKYSDKHCLEVHFQNARSDSIGTMKAKRFLLHPDYDNREEALKTNDIAIVELEGPMMDKSIVGKIPKLDTHQYTCQESGPKSSILKPVTAGYKKDDVLLKMNLRWGFGTVDNDKDCRDKGSDSPNLFMLKSEKQFYGNKGRMDSGDEGSPLFYRPQATKKHKVIGFAISGGSSMYFERNCSKSAGKR